LTIIIATDGYIKFTNLRRQNIVASLLVLHYAKSGRDYARDFAVFVGQSSKLFRAKSK
ncbi:MAG: hypothetical protein US06_C0003G0001, partial [Parcubacteria group bacterium GW2011_GWC2_36_17]